jgi:hypothetical protein
VVSSYIISKDEDYPDWWLFVVFIRPKQAKTTSTFCT